VGHLYRESDKGKGAQGNPGGRGAATIVRSDDTTAQPKTLADYGVSKQQSSDWQKLAAISDGRFEAALAGPEKPTTTALLESMKPPKTASAPTPPRAPCPAAADSAAAEIVRLKARIVELEQENAALRATVATLRKGGLQ
jgi:hypothetical protein